jgi:hypothetical protein
MATFTNSMPIAELLLLKLKKQAFLCIGNIFRKEVRARDKIFKKRAQTAAQN